MYVKVYAPVCTYKRPEEVTRPLGAEVQVFVGCPGELQLHNKCSLTRTHLSSPDICVQTDALVMGCSVYRAQHFSLLLWVQELQNMTPVSISSDFKKESSDSGRLAERQLDI